MSQFGIHHSAYTYIEVEQKISLILLSELSYVVTLTSLLPCLHPSSGHCHLLPSFLLQNSCSNFSIVVFFSSSIFSRYLKTHRHIYFITSKIQTFKIIFKSQCSRDMATVISDFISDSILMSSFIFMTLLLKYTIYTGASGLELSYCYLNVCSVVIFSHIKPSILEKSLLKHRMLSVRFKK